jgi:hypothetical protein
MVKFEDGYETGNIDNYTSKVEEGAGVLIVDTSNPKFGKYHAKCTIPSGAATKRAAVIKAVTPSAKELYCRGYFCLRSTDLPTGAQRLTLFGIYPATAPTEMIGTIYIGAGGEVFLRYRNKEDGIMGYNITTRFVAVKDKWFFVELYAKLGTTDGVVKAWVNGAQTNEVTGLHNDDQGDITECRWGLSTTDVTAAIELDNDQNAFDAAYIGAYVEPVPPTLAETMSEMINLMMSVMMLIMVMQMMTGMMKGLKKK